MIMFSSIKQYCDSVLQSAEQICPERKSLILDPLAQYIQSKVEKGDPILLVFICTHNSRRSHFGQVWAHVAADYFALSEAVTTYSGGTEATAFNTNAIQALERIGFQISSSSNSVSSLENNKNNPVYELKYSDAPCITCFSKVYTDKSNPQENFAAILTCNSAEKCCASIPGAEYRIAITYDDPKEFDNTPQQDMAYDERCRQIATELFYVFSCVADSQRI